jgi:hypothetical protein
MTAMPAGITVRAAEEGDLEGIHVIERASFGDPWSLDGFRDLIGHPRAKLEVALGAAGEVLGYAVAWYVADESEIANIAVAPAARRRGVGGVLARCCSTGFWRPPRNSVRKWFFSKCGNRMKRRENCTRPAILKLPGGEKSTIKARTKTR